MGQRVIIIMNKLPFKGLYAKYQMVPRKGIKLTLTLHIGDLHLMHCSALASLQELTLLGDKGYSTFFCKCCVTQHGH